MGFRANIDPHVRSILLEIPTAHRDEVSDALCTYHGFEEWRLLQNPVIDDTPANRLDFITDILVQRFFEILIERVLEYRIENLPGEIIGGWDS